MLVKRLPAPLGNLALVTATSKAKQISGKTTREKGAKLFFTKYMLMYPGNLKAQLETITINQGIQ